MCRARVARVLRRNNIFIMLSRVVRPVAHHLPESLARRPMLIHEGGITRVCIPTAISSRGAASREYHAGCASLHTYRTLGTSRRE
eukprot:47606-Eustigmatos_ZCMA.PRE.1